MAAMGGLAKLIGENEFPNQFHEGAKDSLYMTIVGSRVVLVFIFDNRTSLGLVRLRIKKASDELMQASHKLAEAVYAKAQGAGPEGGAEAGAAGGGEAKKDDNVVDADFEEVKDDKK